MNDEDIKHIFSRFQNLNLIVLIEDLRRDQVAFGDWYKDSEGEGRLMCPLAHGWNRWAFNEQVSDDELIAAGLEYETVLGEEFYTWFDGRNGTYEWERQKRVVKVLERIYQERLEDADAVQNVIATGDPNCWREEVCSIGDIKLHPGEFNVKVSNEWPTADVGGEG